MDRCFTMLNLQAVEGCSVLDPAPCWPADRSLLSSAPSHRHRRNSPRLTFAVAVGHASRLASTEAPRLEIFSRARRPSHSLHRTVSPCSANVEGRLVAENESLRNVHRKEREARIRKQLQQVTISPSAYDTAWVSMVPLPGSPHAPQFPQCIEWILQKQMDNGSWGIKRIGSSVNKDILLSTLACVIALKKWNLGEEHMRRGLHFIGRDFSIVMDKEITAPLGFNLIFPGLLSLAIGMGLEFPAFRQTDIDEILHLWEEELERLFMEKSDGAKEYVAYVSEGLGNLVDWSEVMKFQRKNGSLFNSPSTTAALLVHKHDDKALQFLSSIVSQFGSAGTSCYVNDAKSLLEIYKASQVSISENEFFLDNMGHWSRSLLMEVQFDGVQRLPFSREIDYALKCPFYTTLERLDHMRNIENFDARDSPMLKAGYLPCGVNEDLLSLAIEDFTLSQSIYQDELLHLDRWVKENRLDQLQFARQRVTYCYLCAAGSITPHQQRDARISIAKTIVLLTVVDDFFDGEGSKENLNDLIALVEKWNEHYNGKLYSEEVKIMFSALYATVKELGSIVSAVQNYDVTEHLIETWQHILRSMMIEAEWRMNQYVPTMEEYMKNAVVSVSSGMVVLSTLYLVEQKLSKWIIKDQEYTELLRLTGTCTRLMNDIQGLEREGSEGKLNSVSLLVHHSVGSISIEMAKLEIRKSIITTTRDLLRLVLREETVIPRPCKELFWKVCKMAHFLYFETDGYSSPEKMVSAVNALIYEPLKVLSYQSTV